VYACGLRNLKQVYVGGKLAVDGTRVLTVDEARLRSEVYTRVARMEQEARAEEAKEGPATTFDLDELDSDGIALAMGP
jgi:hypothetical protein